jgi:hypothetical protein
MNPEFEIDYAAGLRSLSSASLEVIVRAVQEEMPHAWIHRYHRMCNGPTNVLEVPIQTFSYLFDFCTELIDVGELPPNAREDRVVVAYGISRFARSQRDASRIRRFPGSDARGDRGHLVAHAAGGGLDINAFHQNAYLNRGWSPQGKKYRNMERYCANNAGTFFFSRLIYADQTARPAEIEFGILMPDGTFWVEVWQFRCGLTRGST